MSNEAKIVQIRRGTAAEHQDFIGDIGELTMDTDNKTIRVHDGETVGGTALAREQDIPDLSGADYVIAWQMPTAENNYTWYRKYKSGWVEQGGIWTGEIECASDQEASPMVIFPIPMKNCSYYANAAVIDRYLYAMGQIISENHIVFRIGAYYTNRTLTKFSWHICGQAA